MLKFVEHFFWIAAAIDPVGDHPDEMWDEEDGFFYDVLRLPGRHRAAAEGPLARRAAAAVRDDRVRARAYSSVTRRLRRAVAEHLDRNARPARHASPTRSSRASTGAASCRSSTRTSSGAS